MVKVKARYESTTLPGVITNCLVTQEVLDFSVASKGTNSSPTLPVTLPISVLMSARRSGNGIHAKGLVVVFRLDPPEGYARRTRLFIPVLRTFRFNAYQIGDVGMYLGVQVIITAKRFESLGR